MSRTDEHAPARERARLGSAYWRLWTAATISSVGDGVDLAALPLLAASLTRDPRLVAGRWLRAHQLIPEGGAVH